MEKQLVLTETRNGKLPYVSIHFSGWTHDATEIIRVLEWLGYEVKVNCMTYRHHAVISANK